MIEEVKKIIGKVLNDNDVFIEVNEDIKLVDDCGLDSIMAMEILVAVEEKFDIIIDDDDLDLKLLEDVKTLTEYIQKKIKV